MAYSKRALRAADILALVLTGVGLLFFVVALGKLFFSAGDAGLAAKGIKSKAVWIGMRYALAGLVFLVLGIALNVKLKRCVANGEQ